MENTTAIQKPTLAMIRRHLWGNVMLPDIAALYPDCDFQELFELVHDAGPRYITIADRYWLEMMTSTIEEVAASHDRAPEQVVEAMADRGYKPPDVKGWTQWRLSTRHKKALESLGDRAMVHLRQLMEEEENAIHNDGKKIPRTPPHPKDTKATVFLPLTEADKNQLWFLSCHSGTDWHSGGTTPAIQLKVLRTLVEEMIDHMPELEQFRVPDRGKHQAHNALAGERWGTSLLVPYYAYQFLALFQGKRGVQKGQPNLSERFRLALDKLAERDDADEVFASFPSIQRFDKPGWFDKHYAPKNEEGEAKVAYNFRRSVSLSLFQRHRPLVNRGKEVSGLAHQDFLVALFLWDRQIEQSALAGWTDWLEFLRGDWTKGEKPDKCRELLEKLEANHYLVSESR